MLRASALRMRGAKAVSACPPGAEDVAVKGADIPFSPSQVELTLWLARRKRAEFPDQKLYIGGRDVEAARGAAILAGVTLSNAAGALAAFEFRWLKPT